VTTDSTIEQHSIKGISMEKYWLTFFEKGYNGYSQAAIESRQELLGSQGTLYSLIFIGGSIS